MFKIIKEMLPPDVRVARDAQDLLVECCVGRHANDLHNRTLWFNFIILHNYGFHNARIIFDYYT
jgi:hypothetical protein